MKNSDERKLSQYIFGYGKTQEGSVQSCQGRTLKSSFAKWNMIFWEQNLMDGSCVMTDYTARLFGVDPVNSYFPNCLFGKGILSQQTEVAFRRAEYRLRAGEEQFSFEAVVNTAGDMPKWFEVSYSLETDADGVPIYAIGSAQDISSKKMLEQKYDDQIAYRNGLCANTLNCMRIDLTEDKITEYNTPVGEITEMCALFPTADACLRKITEDMVRKSDIEQYKDVLTTEGLLKEYHGGNNRVVVEYYDTMLQKWLQINFVILKNPSNFHVDCFGICNDISENKLLEIALNNISKQDYASVGIIDTLAKEYLYVKGNREDGPVVSAYENIDEVFSDIIDEWKDSFADIATLLAKDTVMSALETEKEYFVTFSDQKDDRRYQVYFSMAEENEQLIMVAIRDITDNALLDRLKYDAEHDKLTGLYNREKAFSESNKLLLEHPYETFMIVHFDIQKFRLYNSFFGEKEGDKLLVYMADMLRELYATHAYGVYGRIEADVFFLCFPYRDQVVEDNQKYIHEKLLGYRADFPVVASCGIYVADHRQLTAEAMFNRAAIAAKDNRNKQMKPVKYFDEKKENKLHIEHEIALDMQRALDEKQFVVYLQPKYEVFSGRPFGAEALVRWVHPEKGMIMPSDFISLFESNGFIIQLDQYMWEEACILLKRWIVEKKSPGAISVNMSRVSMYNPQTVSYLKSLVEKYELPPEMLNLELTESAYMDAPDEMKIRLQELRAAGFKIMMDDFGSGYSSLNTLREIPVDYLKVDRVFLASVDKDLRSRMVLASVIHMASRMGIPMITEGVETEAQREFLASIGCDYVQGFLYARPMPVPEYEEKIIIRQQQYVPKEKESDLQISRIFMNMGTEVQKFANLLPQAFIFIEYVGDTFSYLSGNEKFIQKFGLRNDAITRENLTEHFTSKEKYDSARDMFRRVAKMKTSDSCHIEWKHEDGIYVDYLVQVQYVGTSDYSVVLACSLTENIK